MLEKLKLYVNEHEDWLMSKILFYAEMYDYTKYTSTLQEAWRISIVGLSNSLFKSLDVYGENLELSPDEDYTNDPAAQFGIEEAIKHKDRGVTLAMFLGLMKYYQQSYQDLIYQSGFEDELKRNYLNIIDRFFNRVEIGYCVKWSEEGEAENITAMQIKNREMTNEKNRYLTIFESLSTPVVIVDKDDNIVNYNYAASIHFNLSSRPGENYYSESRESGKFIELFPWIEEIYNLYKDDQSTKMGREITLGERSYHLLLSKSLDVSGKFSGSIVMIEDITERVRQSEEREKLVIDLKRAIEEVKTLKGIVPICMHCKQIRDDKGYWQQLEEFIVKNSEAQLSHGICDQCMEKFYPEDGDDIVMI